MKDQPIHIAVFGDTHGHLRLMFELCRRWQLENRCWLDGILVCGDLGYFPDLSRLDKATKRFAERDPEECGVARFFRLPNPPEADSLLEKTLNGPPDDLATIRTEVVFCHGNHEDFELLEKATGNAAFSSVDCFRRIWLLRSGEVVEVAGLAVGALGGAPEPEADSSDQVLGKYVSNQAMQRLLRKEHTILLAHGSPLGIGGESDMWGSRRIRNVVERCQPAYLFFGHHRTAIAPATIGLTQCFWLNDVNFEPGRSHNYTGPVESGCMGVLQWKSRESHSFKILDEPWLRTVTGSNWGHF